MSKRKLALACLLAAVVLASLATFVGPASSAPARNTYVWSSGPIRVPLTAGSLGWTIINSSAVQETFTITLYQYQWEGQARSMVLESTNVTLLPFAQLQSRGIVGQHVSTNETYELVLTTTSPKVLPTVEAWTDTATSPPIPGTQIPAGSWVRLQ